jgi:iron complex transport system substrate-binding protein
VSRRGVLFAGAALSSGAALTLTGCGSDKKSAKDDSGKSSEGTGSGFPVTLAGKPGPVTVKSAPQRVVAYGNGRDTDLALALGAPLVLASRNASFPDGSSPWARPGSGVTLAAADSGLPVEKIAAARPDLILAADDYALQDDFGKLKALAPTLGTKSGAGKDDWDVMAQRAGDVLGQRAKADRLVASVKAKIAKVRTDHPELAGKTFTFGPVTGGQVYTISSATDPSAVFFSQFGMKLAPQVTTLPASSTPGRSLISPERLDLLEADVLILAYPAAKDRAAFEKGALFRNLKAVKRGAYIALDISTALAVAFPSVLSIPYGLNAAVPQLVKAVAAA